MYLYKSDVIMECVDGLAQDCGNSIALEMELLQSCAKPTMCNSANKYRVKCRTRNNLQKVQIP